MSRMGRWSLNWPFPFGWWPVGADVSEPLKDLGAFSFWTGAIGTYLLSGTVALGSTTLSGTVVLEDYSAASGGFPCGS